MGIKSGLIALRKRPEDITLREACSKYIDRRRSRLSPTTIQGYEKIKDQHFQGIMDKRLGALTSAMIDDAVDDEAKRTSRRGKPLAPKTIANAYMFLASVLNTYVPDLKRDVTLPEVKRIIPRILPPDKIYPAIRGTAIELPCLLAMWLSLSMSEIRGLTKSGSISNGKLIVCETVVDVKGEAVRKVGGKEELRTRAFDIPPHLQTLIDVVDGDILVPLSGHAIYCRFTYLLEKCGLPHMSFHQLRHVNASFMASINVPAPIAQERGGWKTAHVMQRVYTHTFTDQRAVEDARINAYFESIIANNNANE